MLRERDVNTISHQSEGIKKLHSQASGQLRQPPLPSSSFSVLTSSISFPSTTKVSSSPSSKKSGNRPQMWSPTRYKGSDGNEGDNFYTPKTNDEREKYLWGLFKTHSHFEYDVRETSVERGTRGPPRKHQAAETTAMANGSNVVVNRRLTRGEFFSMVSSLRQSEFANRRLLEVTATASTARVSHDEKKNRGGDSSTTSRGGFGELELLMSSDQFAEVIWNRIQIKGGGEREGEQPRAATKHHATSVSWTRVQRALGEIFSPRAPTSFASTVAADVVQRGGAADLNEDREITAVKPSSSRKAKKSTSPAPTDPMASCVDMVRENLGKSLQPSAAGSSSLSAKKTSSVQNDDLSAPRLVSAQVKVLRSKPSRDEDERISFRRGERDSTRHSHSNESSVIATNGNSDEKLHRKEQGKHGTAAAAAAAQRRRRNTSASTSSSYFDPSPEPEWEAPYFEETTADPPDHAATLLVRPANANDEEGPCSLDTIMRKTRRLLAGQSAKPPTSSRRSVQKSNSVRAADAKASSPPRENNSRTAARVHERHTDAMTRAASPNCEDNPSTCNAAENNNNNRSGGSSSSSSTSTINSNDDRQSDLIVSTMNTTNTATRRRLPAVKYFEGEDSADIIGIGNANMNSRQATETNSDPPPPPSFAYNFSSLHHQEGEGERSVFGAELVRSVPLRHKEQLKSEQGSLATAGALVADANESDNKKALDASTSDSSFSDVPVVSITLALNTGSQGNSGRSVVANAPPVRNRRRVPSFLSSVPRDFAFSPFRSVHEYDDTTMRSDAAHGVRNDEGVVAHTHYVDEDKEDELDDAEYNEETLSALYEGLDSVSVPRSQRKRRGGIVGGEHAVVANDCYNADVREENDAEDDGDNTFLRAPSERIIVNLDDDDNVSLTEEEEEKTRDRHFEVVDVKIEIPSPPCHLAQNNNTYSSNSRRASFNASAAAAAAGASVFPTSFSSNTDDTSDGSLDLVAARGTRPPTPNERVGIKYGMATNTNRLLTIRDEDEDRVTVNVQVEEEEIVLSPNSSIGIGASVAVARIESTAAHASFSRTRWIDDEHDDDGGGDTTMSSSVVDSGCKHNTRSTSRALIHSLDEDDENGPQYQDANGQPRQADAKTNTAVYGNTIGNAGTTGLTQCPTASSSSSLYKDRYALRLPTPSPSPSSTSISSLAAVNNNFSTYTTRPVPPIHVDSSDLSTRMIMSPFSSEESRKKVEKTPIPPPVVVEDSVLQRSASPSLIIPIASVGVPIRRSVNLDESQEEDDDLEKAQKCSPSSRKGSFYREEEDKGEARGEGRGKEAFSPTSTFASPDSLSPYCVPHVSKEVVPTRELQRQQSLGNSRGRLVSPPRDDGGYTQNVNHHPNYVHVRMPIASHSRHTASSGQQSPRSRSSPQARASPRSIFYSPSVTARASTPLTCMLPLMSPRINDESFNEEDASTTTIHAEGDGHTTTFNNEERHNKRSEGRGERRPRYGRATDSYAEYYDYSEERDKAAAEENPSSSINTNGVIVTFTNADTEVNDESVIVGGDELSFVHTVPPVGVGDNKAIEGYIAATVIGGILTSHNKAAVVTRNEKLLLAAGGINLPLDAIAASPLKPSSYAPHALGPSTIVRSYSRATSPSAARPSSSSSSSTSVPLSLAAAQVKRSSVACTNSYGLSASASRRFTSSDTRPLLFDNKSVHRDRLLMLGPHQDQDAVLSSARAVSSPAPVAATSRFSLQNGRVVAGAPVGVGMSHSARTSSQTMMRGAHATPSSWDQQRVAAYSGRSAGSSSTAYESSSASYSCYTSSSCRSSSALSASSSSSALSRYVESSQQSSSISPSRRSPSSSLDPLTKTQAGLYGHSGEIQREFHHYNYDGNYRDARKTRTRGLVMGPRLETTSTALDCVSPASTACSESPPDRRGYDQASSYHSHADNNGNSSERRMITRRYSLSDLDAVRKTSAPEPTTTIHKAWSRMACDADHNPNASSLSVRREDEKALEAPPSPSHPRADPLPHRSLPHSSYHRRSLSCPPLLNELLFASVSSGEQQESQDAGRPKEASKVLNGHSDAPPRPTSLTVKAPPLTRPLPLAPKSHMQPLPKKVFNELSGGGRGGARTGGRVLHVDREEPKGSQEQHISEHVHGNERSVSEPSPKQNTASSTPFQPNTNSNKGGGREAGQVGDRSNSKHTAEEAKHFDDKEKKRDEEKDEQPNAVNRATTGGGHNEFSNRSISPLRDQTKTMSQEHQPQRLSSPRAVPPALSPSPKSRSASVGPPAGRGRVKTVVFATGKAVSSSHLSLVSPSSERKGRAAVDDSKSTTATSNATAPSATPSTKTNANENNASSAAISGFDWNSSPLPAERRITFPLSAERPPARRRLQSAERMGIHAPLYYPSSSSSSSSSDAGANPHQQQEGNSTATKEIKEGAPEDAWRKVKEEMLEKPHVLLQSINKASLTVIESEEENDVVVAFSNFNNSSATASAPPPFLQPSTAPPSLSASPAPRSSRNRVRAEEVEEELQTVSSDNNEVLQSTVAHFSSSEGVEKIMVAERSNKSSAALEAEEELAKREVSIDNYYGEKTDQQQERVSSSPLVGSPHFPSRSPPRLPSPSLSTQRSPSGSVRVSVPLMTTQQTNIMLPSTVSTSSPSSFVQLYLRQAQALIIEGGGGVEIDTEEARDTVEKAHQQYQLTMNDVQRDDESERDRRDSSSLRPPLTSLDVPQQSNYNGSRQSTSVASSSYSVSRRLSVAASSMCSAADIVVLNYGEGGRGEKGEGRDFRSRNRFGSMSPPSHAPPPPPTLEVSYSEGSFAVQKRNEPTTTKRVPHKVLRRIDRTITTDKNDERSGDNTVEPTYSGSQHEPADSFRQNASQANGGAEEGMAVAAEGVRRSGPPSLPPSFLRAHQLMPHGPHLIARRASPAFAGGGNITPRASSVDSTASSTRSIVRTPPTTRVVVGHRN